MSEPSPVVIPRAAKHVDPPSPRPWPILTQQPRVPWTWVLLIQLPWFTGSVIESLSSTMMTYTLKKFTDVTYVITLVTSFNLAFNMLVGATCNYASDRVWTRLGRRRPFLLVASLVTVGFLLVIPAVKQFWLLVALLCAYEMIRDIGAPTEALEKEVVPPPQRGRGQAITQIVRLLGGVFFSAVLFGMFDRTYDLPGVGAVSGETLVYWIGAAIALGVGVFYWVGVRELPPPDPLPPPDGRPFGRRVAQFFTDVFGSRHNWAVYMIGVSMMVFWTGLGSLTPLLYTEQWGFSKQTLGWINTSGLVVAALTTLGVARYVDKVDRLRVVNLAAAGMVLHHVAFFAYARSLPPGQAPPVWVLAGFSIIVGVIGNVGTMAAVAAQFDFVSSNQMGTIGAGFGILRTIIALVTNNVVGVWVFYYSRWYAPPGTQDYLAGYHYLIALAVACWLAMVWFSRLARTGRVVRYGVLEQRARTASARVV